jgi:DNA-binding response OmpR family regulator
LCQQWDLLEIGAPSKIMQTGNTAAHVLVVDDEEPVRELLRECLEIDGFRVSEAKNGAELVQRLGEGLVDLITLDLNLGGENGFDVARQVRSTNNIPIVMITGKGDPIDRVVGLELGADDYIVKPFHVREVLARVRAVLRRYDSSAVDTRSQRNEVPSGERFAFGDWILDIPRRELRSPGGGGL